MYVWAVNLYSKVLIITFTITLTKFAFTQFQDNLKALLTSAKKSSSGIVQVCLSVKHSLHAWPHGPLIPITIHRCNSVLFASVIFTICFTTNTNFFFRWGQHDWHTFYRPHSPLVPSTSHSSSALSIPLHHTITASFPVILHPQLYSHHNAWCNNLIMTPLNLHWHFAHALYLSWNKGIYFWICIVNPWNYSIIQIHDKKYPVQRIASYFIRCNLCQFYDASFAWNYYTDMYIQCMGVHTSCLNVRALSIV